MRDPLRNFSLKSVVYRAQSWALCFFNMYLSDISAAIGKASIFTYADDSYVCIEAENHQTAKKLAEETIGNHIAYLEKKGMIVNPQKTELIYFSQKTNPNIVLKLDQIEIKSQSSIKALGITIDRDLTWSLHVNNTVNKVKSLMSGLRIVTNHLNREQSTRIITSQIFSVLYYASPVWLTTELARPHLKRIESSHYASLRIGIKDFRRTISKETINQITKRMPPQRWMMYSSTILAMKIIRDASPTLLYQKIMANSFQERRKPFIIYTYDGSHNKHGKKGFHNWINLPMKKIKFPWIYLTTPITDNKLRIELKKTFCN